MSISSLTSRPRLLALLAASALGVAACGSGETIDAGAGPSDEPTAETTPETLPEEAIGDDVTPEPSGDVTEGFTPMIPRTDLVSLQTATPDNVMVDPANDQRILIHFEGAAEPCSGAAVTVTETDTDVTVVLETGLDPNAAAMSCIAQVFDYEIAVPLDQPLGERTLITGS